MSDVIDDDLMRELGLDDDDIKSIKKPSAAAAESVGLDDVVEVTPKQSVKPAAPAKTPVAPAVQQRAATPPAPAPAAKPSMTDFNESLAKDVPVQLAAVLAKKLST